MDLKFDLSESEREDIESIAKRALRAGLISDSGAYEFIYRLEVLHCNGYSLDLQAFSKANSLHFVRNCNGIRRFYDPITNTFRDDWRPEFKL